MGRPEIESFLTSLAVHASVSASTQNQALAALMFLYRDVLGQPGMSCGPNGPRGFPWC